VNLHVYHYAGNNPVRYVDPDGRKLNNAARTLMNTSSEPLGKGSSLISEEGCVLTAYTRIASAIAGREIDLNYANGLANEKKYFTSSNELSPENGAKLITDLVGDDNLSVVYSGSITADALEGYVLGVFLLDNDYSDSYAIGRLSTVDGNGKQIKHTVNIDSGAALLGTDPNIKINDTSGVRSQVKDDPSKRSNKIDRIDVFEVKKRQADL